MKEQKEETTMKKQAEDRVHFEAVLYSETGKSMFASDAFLGPESLKQFTPASGRGVQAATILQSYGFKVRNIGTFSISAEWAKGIMGKGF